MTPYISSRLTKRSSQDELKDQASGRRERGMDCMCAFCFIVLLMAFPLVFKNRFLKRNFKWNEVSCLDKLYFWREKRGESSGQRHTECYDCFTSCSHSTE